MTLQKAIKDTFELMGGDGEIDNLEDILKQLDELEALESDHFKKKSNFVLQNYRTKNTDKIEELKSDDLKNAETNVTLLKMNLKKSSKDYDKATDDESALATELKRCQELIVLAAMTIILVVMMTLWLQVQW